MTSARVEVDHEVVGSIGAGVALLVGFGRESSGINIEAVAERILNLRIFPDERGRLQHSLRDIGGSILAVPQFTVYARTDRGRRPDFTGALEPNGAEALFRLFVESLKARCQGAVQSGRFGADMQVTLVNDGPFTLILEF